MLSGEVPLVNIAGLAELKEIFDVEGGVSIGSGVCFTDLVKHPLIQQRYPLLVTACKTVGSCSCAIGRLSAATSSTPLRARILCRR